MANQQMEQNTARKNNPVSIVLTVIVFIALGKYLFENREIFDSLKKLNVPNLLILVLIYLIFILVLSYLNKIILHKLDPNIRTSEITLLQFVNNFLNKLLPKGGVAFRALYLKKHYSLPYSYFLASFTGLVVVNLASQALISLFAITLVYLRTGLYNFVIILGFLGILFGALLIMIFRPTIPGNDNWFFRNLRRLVEGWKLIVDDPKDLLRFIIISVVILLIDALNMYVVFYALKTPIQYSTALILSSISILLSYINITPDGLGIREGVYLYVSSIIGLSEIQIVFGSLVQRAVSFLPAFLFGSLGYILLSKNRSKIQIS